MLRSRLVERLSGENGSPVVVLSAGPGYGKTTALAQWAATDNRRRFAWVSIDRHDDDPVVLLTYVAAALDRLSPLDPSVFEALASAGASVEATIVPRLGSAFAGMKTPVVLVLDDVHAITNPQCIDAIVALADDISGESQLALSTRDRTALPLARLRTREVMRELGPDDLRMDEAEARALLDTAGVEASDDLVSKLVNHTEGWPAGLYLAALSAQTTGARSGRMSPLTGNDPFVVEFLQSEFLMQLPPAQLRLLKETSILDELSGPLCDAILGSTDSAAVLDSLERSNGFVVALDREREWYRCHTLVRELLATELAHSGQDAVLLLLSRAFDWCAANGQETAAIAYGQAAGDRDRVAATMERCIQPVFQSGRAATVAQWLDWLEAHDGLTRYPAVAVIGSMFYAVTGRPTASDRWGDAAELGTYEGHLPDGSESIESWRALLRAFRCRHGVAAMRSDALLAVESLAPGSEWRPAAVVVLGLAELMSGFPDEADDRFADAA
ncbi:MAG: hypothetical protein E6G41_12490, partial [Actinobacteria bacterium]